MNECVCSIIMPVFNGEKYISSSLDSILAQKTTYPFEIIIVNDGSTDATNEIVRNYADKFNHIVLLNNEKNYGKGYSFQRAYAKARGRYFHVLDADDVFTNTNKLHKQIDFLEKNPDFIAVCHNTFLVYPENEISILINIFEERIFSYEQCILNEIYAHTSAIMYRKIVDKLPEYFNLEAFRGDSAVFKFHLLKSKRKLKYFPDIHSIYYWNGGGIWNSLNAINQRELNVDILTQTQKYMIGNKSSPEWKTIQNNIDYLATIPIEHKNRKKIDMMSIISFCVRYCSQIFSDTSYFNAVFSSKVVDQIAETIGRWFILKQGLCLSDKPYNDVAVIALSVLNKTGGGIYAELQDLSKALLTKYKKVYVVSSEWLENNENDLHEAFDDPRIEVIKIDHSLNYLEKILALINIFYEIRGKVLYPFITHLDIPLNAAIQSGLFKTVIMDFCYDHGLVMGLNNSSIDSFIVKNDSQLDAINYHVTNANFTKCHPLLKDKFSTKIYIPYKNNILTTASASARVYKAKSNYIYEFIDVIIAIIGKTNGHHYHYGQLDRETIAFFQNKFDKAGIPFDHFIHIDWTDNLGLSMLNMGVDLFVSTFPICSARTVVEMMSAGIPIINHKVINPTIYPPADFCDPEQYLWSDMDDLKTIISSLNKVSLEKKSRSARQWFIKNNNYESHIDQFIQASGSPYSIVNNPSIYIYDYDRINGDHLLQRIFDSMQSI
ncbi:glycosyltransferase family 2 protein [Bartonella tamiae]|uniref:Glycosyltransferase 2-like domain-containing protein n=1 Tax=Bartonella tamiae Th239 TaxID=1094558 RepID=J0QXJ1_9HYPH|nr:glycosyltransferase [Bartonella tamiae]EJF90776.1 hypothetical protein ME5_00644 [Bartonella tamiae Th239]EJF93407.1 hypothetical protein MEG_01238 [Bartonella tamiae Th307]